MAFTKRIIIGYFLIFFVLFSSGYILNEQDYSLAEALKVLQAIEKVQRRQSSESRFSPNKIVITESELNSYIAYRIETEKEEVMKMLRLKLFEENRIEGKILIDLRGKKIPKFLRPQMSLYFDAALQVKSGYARLDVKKLFLEGQPIQPVILDLIISIASKLDDEEPSSLKDWYELPYGIKDIKTHQGKADFYY